MGTQHTAPAIRTCALTKSFVAKGSEPLLAVNSLDLEVRPGEIFGLLGPNGAGKTTTIGMLTTRVIPTSGSAWVGGVDVIAHPAAAKALIGVASQTNTLDRSLDARENLVFHGRYFGMSPKNARQVADELLERFKLSDRANSQVIALSGGMAQRLMVARAVMHSPEVIFLDEPTTGLDPQSRIALWELVAELHDAGQTILLTTHSMEEADQLCDRVAIMDHGEILALDTPDALKKSLGADTLVRITSSGDLEGLAAAVVGLEGATGVDVRDGVVNLYLRGVEGALPKVISRVDAAGWPVHDVSATEPTLETVFLSLTGKDLRE